MHANMSTQCFFQRKIYFLDFINSVWALFPLLSAKTNSFYVYIYTSLKLNYGAVVARWLAHLPVGQVFKSP